MKIERTKNAARNIKTGLILRIYQMAVPFLMRTVMIYWLGVEYVGLNSLFTSVLQVLNLAELGVGSAMVYSMYKPIAEDDTAQICALINLYKKYYRIIGLVILVAGILLTPFIPSLISGDVPSDISIYILYWLNLAATVLSYWLFAYKNAIFAAHQRIDISNNILLFTDTLKYILQFVVLIAFRNYYYYVIVLLISQLLNNVVTAYQAGKMYPEYVAEGVLDNHDVSAINKRVRDLFTSKLGAVVINASDTIVISAFLGLTVLAIYQNYYYIITAVIGLVSIVFNACTAGIGNSIIVETKEKNYNDLKKFTFIIAWIAGFCMVCLLCLFQPFMKLWVGESLMVDFSIVICFCVYYFVFEINQLLNLYKDAAGMWHEDRWRPLTTAIVNVTLNLFMVRPLGLYGIILSTVISMIFVGMPWLLHNLFTTIFEKKYMRDYFNHLLIYIGVTIIACLVSVSICNLAEFNEWITLIYRFIICCIVPNSIFLLAYRQTIELKQCLNMLNNMLNGKLNKLISKI